MTVDKTVLKFLTKYTEGGKWLAVSSGRFTQAQAASCFQWILNSVEQGLGLSYRESNGGIQPEAGHHTK
jgi:hypothetical protein